MLQSVASYSSTVSSPVINKGVPFGSLANLSQFFPQTTTLYQLGTFIYSSHFFVEIDSTTEPDVTTDPEGVLFITAGAPKLAKNCTFIVLKVIILKYAYLK